MAGAGATVGMTRVGRVSHDASQPVRAFAEARYQIRPLPSVVTASTRTEKLVGRTTRIRLLVVGLVLRRTAVVVQRVLPMIAPAGSWPGACGVAAGSRLELGLGTVWAE